MLHFSMHKNTVVALLYDFDKTLCTKDMQEYTFIPNVNMTANEFWAEASNLARMYKMDRILSYMYLMLEKAKAERVSIRREDFVALGRDLELYAGVNTWFTRMQDYGRSLGLEVQHYIISSGLREIIEGSEIWKYFSEVFACEFFYKNDIACWPKNVVNYTTKTQFLFRISKGALDISDDIEVNRQKSAHDYIIPFKNMIYIGDGLTDIPCMKLVKSYGGHSIAVYKSGELDAVKILLNEERVNFAYPADYREGSEIDGAVKKILHKIQIDTELENRASELCAQLSNAPATL